MPHAVPVGAALETPASFNLSIDAGPVRACVLSAVEIWTHVSCLCVSSQVYT